MKVIYTPAGKAREYSPLALNIYAGCDHGCYYCYVPSILKKTREQYNTVAERKDFLNKLRHDCLNIIDKKQVLLCFSGDPYCKFNEISQMTSQVLKVLLNHNFPVSILSKGGKRILTDLDIFKMFGQNIKIGQTLTFINSQKSKEWEPEASLPEERIEIFRILKENNIKTWASIEPVIDPNESIRIIKATLPYCDEYQVGKLNHMPDVENQITWGRFLKITIDLLRQHNKKIYIKQDLVKAGKGVKLHNHETEMDRLAIKPIQTEKTLF